MINSDCRFQFSVKLKAIINSITKPFATTEGVAPGEWTCRSPILGAREGHPLRKDGILGYILL